jgi:uncharacterized protein YggE
VGSDPRRLWTAGAALAVVAALAVFGLRGGTAAADTATGASTQQTLAVSGSGSATITPDEANVTLGVTAQASTAQQALADDSSTMKSVVAAIEGQGVAETDLRTTGLNLSPTYTPGGPDRAPQVSGFQASNNVDVTLHDTSKVGAVIDAALAAGANQVGGVSFTASQPQTAYNQAYAAAMANAQSAAAAVAKAAGLTLGSIHSISASQGGCCVMQFASAGVASAAAPAPPVFGGQETVSVTLQVVYNTGP